MRVPVLTAFALPLVLSFASVAAAQVDCPCVQPDAGGTAVFIPACTDGYRGPMLIADGLPPASTINVDCVVYQIGNVTEITGGNLGGTSSSFSYVMDMYLSGTGALNGFSRTVTYPLALGVAHAAPRTAGQPVQSFATDMYQMFSQVFGDPDFDLLRITIGTGYGLPSPGQTIFTRLGPPGSSFAVDSFFDITYRIDFIGASGGPLAGRSGSTTGESHMVLCEGAVAVEARSWGAIKALY